jgi:hypothetical protein
MLVAGFCLTSPCVCVTVSITAVVPHLAVIIRLNLSLGTADGQCGCVSWVGARESVRDAWRPVLITINDQHRGLACLLLIPVHVITFNAVSSTGVPGRLSQCNWCWGWLRQHIRGYRAWKEIRRDWILFNFLIINQPQLNCSRCRNSMAPQSPFLAGSEYPVHARDLLRSEAWPGKSHSLELGCWLGWVWENPVQWRRRLKRSGVQAIMGEVLILLPTP